MIQRASTIAVVSIAWGLSAGGGGLAWAQADQPDAALVSSISSSPILARFRRVAVAVQGQRTPEALAAQRNVAGAFERSGHEVVVLDVPLAPSFLPSDVVSKIRTEQSADALVAVRIWTTEKGRGLSLITFDLDGLTVFQLDREQPVAAPPPPLPRAIPAREPPRPLVSPGFDPMVLEGPGFYDAVGRPDLARAYRHRQVGKTIVLSVGGAALTVGVLWGLADLFLEVATAPFTVLCETSRPASECRKKDTNPMPVLLIVAGAGMVIFPAFVPNDPLTDAQKRELVYGRGGAGPARGNSVTVGFAPLPGAGGGTLVVRGAF